MNVNIESRDLFTRTLSALECASVERKLDLVAELRRDWEQGRLALEEQTTDVAPIGEPGRPARPVLVSPLEVERRSVHTAEGHAALIHALTHIEFNAINLALDAVYRFRSLPSDYYDDWLRVAAEEALHFRLLRDHLRALGYDYGAFSAHHGLWEMAVKTAHDPLVRMALVPRVLEARGLDASPAIVTKLHARGDRAGADILAIIQRDEIGHVRIGNRWYGYFCAQRGLDPIDTFRRLLREYDAPRVRPPFDTAARQAAGFNETELAVLTEFAQTKG